MVFSMASHFLQGNPDQKLENCKRLIKENPFDEGNEMVFSFQNYMLG